MPVIRKTKARAVTAVAPVMVRLMAMASVCGASAGISRGDPSGQQGTVTPPEETCIEQPFSASQAYSLEILPREFLGGRSGFL